MYHAPSNSPQPAFAAHVRRQLVAGQEHTAQLRLGLERLQQPDPVHRRQSTLVVQHALVPLCHVLLRKKRRDRFRVNIGRRFGRTPAAGRLCPDRLLIAGPESERHSRFRQWRGSFLTRGVLAVKLRFNKELEHRRCRWLVHAPGWRKRLAPFFFNDRRESQDRDRGTEPPSDCRCRFRPASLRPWQIICAVVDFLDSFEESSSPMSTTPKYVYTFGSGKADGRSDMKDLLGG